MEKSKFTKEKKADLLQKMYATLDEIREICKNTSMKKVSIDTRIYIKGRHLWKLCVTKNTIYLDRYDTQIILETSVGNKKIRIKDPQVCMDFLVAKPSTLASLESIVSSSNYEKEKNFKTIDELIENYSKAPILEEKNQEKKHEITEIDFGYATINLITKGDIILQKPEEKEELDSTTFDKLLRKKRSSNLMLEPRGIVKRGKIYKGE